MKTISKLTLGLALSVLASAALAVPVGSWDAYDAKKSHGIWFNKKLKYNGKKDRTFNIQAGTMFTVDATGAAYLTGSAYSSKLGGGFNFNVGFNWLCNGVSAQAGTCGPVQANQTSFGGVSVPLAQQASWDFFEMAGPQTLTGFGNLSGLDITITQYPGDGSKPFRIGEGANWFDLNQYGGSGWFSVSSILNNSNAKTNGVSRGDFNLDLVAVPEPSTVFLMGLGLVGVGLTRRLKKS